MADKFGAGRGSDTYPSRSTTEVAAHNAATIQDRPPNFRENGKLYLVRCFACGGERGTENYVLAVGHGTCAFCGWNEADNG